MCLLCRRPFRWSCRRVEAKHVALPDATCPRLHRKPLDAAIRQLLALYRPNGCQGDNQQNDDAKCTIAMRRYYTACIAQWRRFMAFIKATKRRHWASTCSDIINRTHQRRFIIEKWLQLTWWPLITIGI
jgi:hypothetical protein